MMRLEFNENDHICMHIRTCTHSNNTVDPDLYLKTSHNQLIVVLNSIVFLWIVHVRVISPLG